MKTRRTCWSGMELVASELMSWAEQTSTWSFEEAGEGDRNTVSYVSATERERGATQYQILSFLPDVSA